MKRFLQKKLNKQIAEQYRAFYGLDLEADDIMYDKFGQYFFNFKEYKK